MSLAFDDFAAFYRDSGMTDAQQREHFDSFSAILECIARLFWPHQTPALSSLGITLDLDSLALIGAVESNEMLRDGFNEATCIGAAGSDTQ